MNIDSDFPAMGKLRYTQLECDLNTKLTPEEVEAGWHFCNDWDGMLIHTSWKLEYEHCSCNCKKKANG